MDLEVLQSAVPPPRQLLLQFLLLLLFLLTLSWASLGPVVTAVTFGGLGLASFLLVAAWPHRKSPPARLSKTPQATANPPSGGGDLARRRMACPPSVLPLSSQISADYSDTDGSPVQGSADLPPRLFQVVQEPASLLDLDNWRYAEQKAEEAVRVTHFAWTIPRWKGVRSVTELESAEFRDELMEGVSWRYLIRRDPGAPRLLVLVKAAQLSPADFPEGRLFAEVSCSCEGLRKSTFGAFYPGLYQFVLALDTPLLGSGAVALTVSCTAAVFTSVRVHQLAQLPPTCQTDDGGRYVNCHSAGVRWQVADWERFAWETGWAIFSPLFSCAALPSHLWQVHLFPESDDPASAGHLSAFLKLVDCPAIGGPVEVDFQLTFQGDEEGGLFDTASFARGAAHGFRGIRRLVELRGCPLLVECALRLKLPLFT